MMNPSDFDYTLVNHIFDVLQTNTRLISALPQNPSDSKPELQAKFNAGLQFAFNYTQPTSNLLASLPGNGYFFGDLPDSLPLRGLNAENCLEQKNEKTQTKKTEPLGNDLTSYSDDSKTDTSSLEKSENELKGGSKRKNDKMSTSKRGWTQEDDETLRKLGTQYKNDWKKVSKRFLTLRGVKKTPTFLRNRYKVVKEQYPHLQSRFSKEEDQKLIELINLHHMNWWKIAKEFNGRDPISLKNRYYSSIRKKMSLSKQKSEETGKTKKEDLKEMETEKSHFNPKTEIEQPKTQIPIPFQQPLLMLNSLQFPPMNFHQLNIVPQIPTVNVPIITGKGFQPTKSFSLSKAVGLKSGLLKSFNNM